MNFGKRRNHIASLIPRNVNDGAPARGASGEPRRAAVEHQPHPVTQPTMKLSEHRPIPAAHSMNIPPAPACVQYLLSQGFQCACCITPTAVANHTRCYGAKLALLSGTGRAKSASRATVFAPCARLQVFTPRDSWDTAGSTDDKPVGSRGDGSSACGGKAVRPGLEVRQVSERQQAGGA